MQVKKKDWLDLVRDYPVAFGIESGFTDLVDIHNEWIKSFLFREDDMTLQAHRGSYKTTCLSIAMALMIVVYPNQEAIFLRKTDDDVKTIMAQVVKLLQTDIFQTLAYELYGVEIKLTAESVYEIDTNLHVSTSGAPQLSALSLGGSLTGQHADVIITDDIVTMKDRISRAHRNQTKLVYQELENVKNRGGRFINTGTPWHKDDAFELMPDIQAFDIYSTGLVSDDEIKQLRNRMTPSLFAANYELKHIADTEAMFTAPKFFGDISKLYDGVTQIDAAYGGEDSTAVTYANEIQGKVYALGKLFEKHVDDSLNKIEKLHEHYRSGTIYNERNADKGYLDKELKKRGLPSATYHESTNKFIKISTHLRGRWSDVYFHEDTDPEYLSQILDFTESAEHDDAPDSLASVIRIFDRQKKNKPMNVNKAIQNVRRLGL